MKKTKYNWWIFAYIVVLIEGLGFLSSQVSGDIKSKYAALSLPPLSPPGWLFGVMWPLLYLLIAIATYRVFMSSDLLRGKALTTLAVGILLNLLWSPVFFGLGLYWAAVILIAAMDVLTVLTIRQFRRIDKAAAWLLVPYLLWLIFATYLTIGVALKN